MTPTGILAIWHDIVPEHAGSVLDWYDREHHFERLAVPGFHSVRRYEAEVGSPRLFIRYETRDTEVLSSPDYLARVDNPTPWTLRCQPQFRNNSRTVCTREARGGGAEGGYVATIRIDNRHAATDWQRAAEATGRLWGVVGWELWRADLARSTIPTREKELRGGEDSYVAAVVVLHATGRMAADSALAAFTSAIGAVEGVETGIYRLAFAAGPS